MSRLLNTVFYSLAVAAVAVALIVAWLSRFTVEIPLSDKTMRPAIGPMQTRFDVDTGWLEDPERNSFVAFIPPGDSTAAYRATRVVALAGDRFEIRNRKPHVNGAVPAGLRRTFPIESFPEFIVPRGCVIVLNDAPGRTDSVEFGPLPLWRVAGKLVTKR